MRPPTLCEKLCGVFETSRWGWRDLRVSCGQCCASGVSLGGLWAESQLLGVSEAMMRLAPDSTLWSFSRVSTRSRLHSTCSLACSPLTLSPILHTSLSTSPPSIHPSIITFSVLGPDIGGRSCCSLRCAAGGPVSGALPAAPSNSSRSVCRPPCVAALHKSQGCSEAWVGGHIAPYCRVTAMADSVIDCIAERALVCTVGGSGRPAEDAWFSDARKPTRFAGGASIIVLFVTTRLNVCHHF